MAEQAGFEGALGVSLDRPLASVGARGVAHMLDQGLLFAVSIVAIFLAWGLGAFAGDGAWLLALFSLAQFLLQWFWFAGWELFWGGRTPGKAWMGLRVVRTDGTPVGALGALIRNFLRMVDFLPGAYGIGAVLVLLDARARRLGDLAGGTLVIVDREVASTRRRMPEGLAAADVALVQQWFRRQGTLAPERRTALAIQLQQSLAERYPHLEWGSGEAVVQLEEAFPKETVGG